MATSSNTYTTLSSQETYGEILRCGAGFTFVDFLPGVIETSGLFRSATFENFRTLVNRANEFLRSNRRWKIVSCESVEFKSRINRDPIKMTYREDGEGYTPFIRGLRLWLTERKDEKEEEQQIGYINLIPELVEKGGIFKAPKYETLDSLIKRFNSKLLSNPIPGRIITIESQEVKCSNSKDFDPDRSNWTKIGKKAKSFLFVIRIFYEITAGTSEEIGMTDFIPSTISEFSLPIYEPFSNVINKASTWLSNQGNLRFCNAQTLEIKVRRGCEINTQRMDYTESDSKTTYYVRILRIAYTKTFEKPSLIRQLTCRTFTPLQLTRGVIVAKYENLAITKERISAWVRATGARVVSAETAAYRIKSGGERKYGIETTYTYNRAEEDEYWMFVLRLYLDGVYTEPPPEMLPAVPAIEESSSCNVS